MPEDGAGGQNLGHPKKYYILFFLLCLPLLKTLGETSVIHMTQPFLSRNEGQSDLYFMVDWLCLISWRLFDGWIIILGKMVSVTQKLTHKIYVGQWLIFHGPVVLPYIFKTIWWMKIILWIMDLCDTKIDLIKYIYIYVGDLYFVVQWFCFGDLYFVVQWFCLIS